MGFALAAVALLAIGDAPQTLVLPLGLPDLPFHVRLDALSAFFLFLLGVGRRRHFDLLRRLFPRRAKARHPGLLCLQYHTFLAAMALVLIADDAYVFMVAWETMALSSYFLVTTDHRIPEIRRAGFLYLLIAHIGAIGILLCFGVLQGGSGDYTFAGMRSVPAVGILGIDRVPARAVRLRRQGRPGAAARLASRSAPRGAFAGVGIDERRDVEDRDLRPVARDLRSAARSSSGGGASWRSGWASSPRSSA